MRITSQTHLDKVIRKEPYPENLPTEYLREIRSEALCGKVRLGYALSILHELESRED